MKNFFNGIYKGKTVLITGHTGFKGSWLALWLHHLGAKVVGFSLKELSYPSHYELLNLKMESVFEDIRNREKIDLCFKKFRPEIIFHLAAQSLVRESYKDPVYTYETNTIGTLNVLEAARDCASVKALIIITSDKVYENREWPWGYREIDRFGGYDPYSSSKACAELITVSYRKSFFVHAHSKILIATCRAGNVVGGGDWAKDRLLPDIFRATGNDHVVEIRNPHSVRPWQHVLEPLSGYLLLGEKLLNGESDYAEGWNFGPANNEKIEVDYVIKMIQKYWPKVKCKETRKKNAFYEASRLSLDCSKAYQMLHWFPVWSTEETLKMTTKWYKDYYSGNHNHNSRSTSDLLQYIQDARGKKVTWIH